MKEEVAEVVSDTLIDKRELLFNSMPLRRKLIFCRFTPVASQVNDMV